MQRIEISQAMDKTDNPGKVEEALRAVDDFTGCINKNGKLRPIVNTLRPSKLGNACRYIRYLGEALFDFSCNSQELEPDWLLDGIRTTVGQLIREVKPLHRIHEDILIIQVFYTTDRLLTVDGEYGGIPESRKTLHYGKTGVSIPRDLRRGAKLEAPQAGDAQYCLEPYVHICEEKRFLEDKEGFFRELNVYINEKAGRPDVLIYIHGYNAKLTKDVRCLAKLKKDLDFEGAVILYSWSSGGEIAAYYSDERTVCATISPLHEFILDIQHKVLDGYKSVGSCELNSYFQQFYFWPSINAYLAIFTCSCRSRRPDIHVRAGFT